MTGTSGNKMHMDYVDAAKALAIFAVILGHTVPGESKLFTFLFAFHMPAFFFFSGYCTRPGFTEAEDFGTYLRKKARSLLIPFVVFCIYGLILALLFPADWWNDKGISYNLQRYFYYAQPTSGGAVWFLVCLFFSSLITYGAVWMAASLAQLCQKTYPGKEKQIENMVLCIEIVILALVGTVLIPRLQIPYHNRLPWKIDTAVVAAAFQVLGYGTAKEKVLEKIPYPLRYAGLVLLPLIIWFVGVKHNTYVNLCDISYGNTIRFFVAAMSGILWLLDLGWVFKDCRWLCRLGRNTLVIFGIHTLPLWICTEIYSVYTGVHSYYVSDIICAFIVAIVTYAACAGIVFIWNRTKLHFLIRRLMAGKS